ncbi:MAG: cell division protein FtsW [Lachnospiraceae bacterium]|nr:cell division protein FtsW [Lachnospiraceae bacterium]
MRERQSRRREVNKGENGHFDFVLLIVVLFLVAFGLLMIYSASSYKAGLDYGDPAFFLKKQLLSTVIGLVALVITVRIPYRFWKELDIWICLVGILVIPLVKIPGLGVTANGATRWLDLKVVTVQPAEITKLCMIIYMAAVIAKLGKKVRTTAGLALAFVPPAIAAILIYAVTKNLSSAIIVLGIAVAMLFVALPDYKVFVIAGISVVAVVVGVVLYAVGADDVESFRLVRVQAWLHPEDFSTDRAFQTLQSLYAIGSGGIWGKGLGQSMQKMGFLPEAQNDMIFSILCEELGLFGAMAVILLFIVLIWSCMIIANNTEDLFGALLVVGVMAHFAIQVILNIGVVTNTIPNTGITLPFISYGGSSVVLLLIEIGLVLNVSRGMRE